MRAQARAASQVGLLAKIRSASDVVFSHHQPYLSGSDSAQLVGRLDASSHPVPIADQQQQRGVRLRRYIPGPAQPRQDPAGLEPRVLAQQPSIWFGRSASGGSRGLLPPVDTEPGESLPSSPLRAALPVKPEANPLRLSG